MKKGFKVVAMFLVVCSLCLLASCDKDKKTTTENTTGGVTTINATTVAPTTSRITTARAKQVTGIAMEVTPKASYEQYQELDLTNGEIKVYYDNNTSEIIPLNANMLAVDANTSTLGEKRINVTYNGFSTHYMINVDERTIDVSVEGYEGYYDGKYHALSLTGLEEEDVVTYMCDGYETIGEPFEVNKIGTYDVSYKIEREGYKTLIGEETIVIKDMDVMGKWVSQDGNVIYLDTYEKYLVDKAGNASEIKAINKNGDNYRIDYMDYYEKKKLQKNVTYDKNTDTLIADDETFYRLEETSYLDGGYYLSDNSVSAFVNGETGEITLSAIIKNSKTTQTYGTYKTSDNNYFIINKSRFSVEAVLKQDDGFLVRTLVTGYLFYEATSLQLTFIKNVITADYNGVYSSQDGAIIVIDTNNGQFIADGGIKDILNISNNQIALSDIDSTIITITEQNFTYNEKTYSYLYPVTYVEEEQDYILKQANRIADNSEYVTIKIQPEYIELANYGSIRDESTSAYFINEDQLFVYISEAWVKIDLTKYEEIDYSKAIDINCGDEVVLDSTFDYKVYKVSVTDKDVYLYIHGIENKAKAFIIGEEEITLKYGIEGYKIVVGNTGRDLENYVFTEKNSEVFVFVVNDGITTGNKVTIGVSEEMYAKDCVLLPIEASSTNPIYELEFIDFSGTVIDVKGYNGFDNLAISFYNGYYYENESLCNILFSADGKTAFVYGSKPGVVTCTEYIVVEEYNSSDFNDREYNSKYGDYNLKFKNNKGTFCLIYNDDISLNTIYCDGTNIVIIDRDEKCALVGDYDGTKDLFKFVGYDGYDVEEGQIIKDEETITLKRFNDTINFGGILYYEEYDEIITTYWIENNQICVMDVKDSCNIKKYDFVAEGENQIGYCDEEGEYNYIYCTENGDFINDYYDLFHKIFIKSLNQDLIGKTFKTDQYYIEVLENGVVRYCNFLDTNNLYILNQEQFEISFVDLAFSLNDKDEYTFYDEIISEWEITPIAEFDYTETTKVEITIEESQYYYFINDIDLSSININHPGTIILTDENGNPLFVGIICMGEIYHANLKKGTYYLYYTVYEEKSESTTINIPTEGTVKGQLLIKSIEEYDEMLKDKVFITNEINTRSIISINALGVYADETQTLDENNIWGTSQKKIFPIYDINENGIVSGEMQDVIVKLTYKNGKFVLTIIDRDLVNLTKKVSLIPVSEPIYINVFEAGDYSDTFKAGVYMATGIMASGNKSTVIVDIKADGTSTIMMTNELTTGNITISPLMSGYAVGCNGGMCVISAPISTEDPNNKNLYIYINEGESENVDFPTTNSSPIFNMTYVNEEVDSYLFNEQVFDSSHVVYSKNQEIGYWLFYGTNGDVLVVGKTAETGKIITAAEFAEAKKFVADEENSIINGCWISTDLNKIIVAKDGEYRVIYGDGSENNNGKIYYSKPEKIGVNYFSLANTMDKMFTTGMEIVYVVEEDKLVISGMSYKRIEELSVNTIVSMMSDSKNDAKLISIGMGVLGLHYEKIIINSSVIEVTLNGCYDLFSLVEFDEVVILDENKNLLDIKKRGLAYSGLESGYGVDLGEFIGQKIYIVFIGMEINEVAFISHEYCKTMMTLYFSTFGIDMSFEENFAGAKSAIGNYFMYYNEKEKISYVYNINDGALEENQSQIEYYCDSLINPSVYPYMNEIPAYMPFSFAGGIMIPGFESAT